MKKEASALIPVIAIDRRSNRALHRQIHDAFRTAILNGELASGQQVPSTRLLSKELGISRIPLIAAYEELLSEGYFESRRGSGTYVSRSLPEKLTMCEPSATRAHASRSTARPLSKRSSVYPAIDRPPWVVGKGAFSIGQPAFITFPCTSGRVSSRVTGARSARSPCNTETRPADKICARRSRATCAAREPCAANRSRS